MKTAIRLALTVAVFGVGVAVPSLTLAQDKTDAPGTTTTTATTTATDPATTTDKDDDPTAHNPGVVSPDPISGNAALLTCSKSAIAITDISQRSGRVRILGVTAPANAGKEIHIAFRLATNVIARVNAAADGSFRADVALPSRHVIGLDTTRYRATIPGSKTPWLKLTRRLQVVGLHPLGTDLEISGKLIPPLATGATVTVTSQSDCLKPPVTIGTLAVAPEDGAFYTVIPLPATASGFVVRMSATVRTRTGTTTTYSIARPIQVRPGPAPPAAPLTPPSTAPPKES